MFFFPPCLPVSASLEGATDGEKVSLCPHLPACRASLPSTILRMLLEVGKIGVGGPYLHSWDIFCGKCRNQPEGHICFLIAAHVVQGT
jgi:hypothetical protein